MTDTPVPVTREDVLGRALLTAVNAGNAALAAGGITRDALKAIVDAMHEGLEAAHQLVPSPHIGVRGYAKSDTDDAVLFYEQEFYPLSNFSAFAVEIFGTVFPTSEHAYHYAKFAGVDTPGAIRAREAVVTSLSAHDAYKIAQAYKAHRNPRWDDVKEAAMREILVAKVKQNPYVAKKLAETGHRRLYEDSWRDDYWGWGPDRAGKNRLGAIWEGIRHDLNAGLLPAAESRKATPWADVDETTSWNIDQFAAAQHEGVTAFVAHWKSAVARGEPYPQEMGPGDWEEQFQAFTSMDQ